MFGISSPEAVRPLEPSGCMVKVEWGSSERWAAGLASDAVGVLSTSAAAPTPTSVVRSREDPEVDMVVLQLVEGGKQFAVNLRRAGTVGKVRRARDPETAPGRGTMAR